MKQRRRQKGAWSKDNEAAYSVVEWNDSTGDAEIWEYGADDILLRRFVWVLAPDAEPRALLIEFAPDGTEVGRERMSGAWASDGW